MLNTIRKCPTPPLNPFRLRFETQSNFQYLPFLTRIFKALKAPKAYPLTQILVEAYNNAVIHGHRNKKHLWIGIDILLTREKAQIRVSDLGFGFRKGKKEPKNLWQTTGRGLELIRAHADKITSKQKGGLHIFEAVSYF